MYRLLAERGLPVPRHLVCASDDLDGRVEFVRSLGSPDRRQAGRSVGGGDRGHHRRHAASWTSRRRLAYGGAFDRDLLIEETVTGGVYRLLYLDGELLDAVLRAPPTVVGDGASSIERLIETENDRPGPRHRGVSVAHQDRRGAQVHAAACRAGPLRSVPAAGEVVLLKNVVNDNRREDNESAAEPLCAAIVEAGAEAAAIVGTRLAGVDVITPDPSAPWPTRAVRSSRSTSRRATTTTTKNARAGCRWPALMAWQHLVEEAT